jgi:antitoxin YefM
MKVISSSELRKALKDYLDQMQDDHELIIITRKNAPPAVLLSMEDYSALDTTEYLLSTPANARRLSESLAEISPGKGKKHQLAKSKS